jgi:hypothetical protein
VYKALGFGVPAMAENIAAKDAIVTGWPCAYFGFGLLTCERNA